MTSTFNTNASAYASTDSDATAMSDDILSITHGIAALSLQNNPKPLLISDENKQMFDKIFKSFKRHIRLHPPAFPKREVPNDPFECRCRYCSTHDIEIEPVRYGEVTATMLDDAIKRRAKKCQRYILKIHIPDEQRKLLDDLCLNHTNISLQPAVLIREKRCSCEHCNPSNNDIAAAIKAITTRKYGLPTSNEIKRAINIFNLNCPYKLGVHFTLDNNKSYVEFDDKKTPHSPRSKDISIAINDALTYANSTIHDFEFLIDSDSDLSEKNFELPSFDT
jgi:hypothetical protein